MSILQLVTNILGLLVVAVPLAVGIIKAVRKLVSILESHQALVTKVSSVVTTVDELMRTVDGLVKRVEAFEQAKTPAP